MNFWTDIMPGIQSAQAMLTAANDDMNRLPENVRVFLLVNGAQGIVDNGGYKYFFEQDWPGTPTYEDFAEAYEAIGCVHQAADLRRIAGTFPFPEPHRRKEERNAFIDARYDDSTHCVPEWGDDLCGDKEVWERLAVHYKMNKKDFPTPPERKPWWKVW